MNSARSLVIAIGVVILGGAVLSGQVTSERDMSRYRAYALASGLDSVVAASGARTTDATTLHGRPAHIQELRWRAPYLSSRATLADPVRDILFSFYNDALYQLVVTYDRDRTDGLTNGDIIDSVSAAYGAPARAASNTRATPPSAEVPDSVVLARWEHGDSVMTLVRGTYTPDFRLVLMSRSLSTRAQSAIREAIRLDASEAPRREAEQRQKEATDARDAGDRKRETNKAGFRP